MKQLIAAFEGLGISYDEIVLEQFRLYMERILKWNESINITSIKEEEEFIQKHYIDSLLCAPSKEFHRAKRIIDVGTGGGFPGVPLALIAPDKEFVLMDSLNKRIKIIQELCEELGIKNVTAVHDRAEDLAQKKGHREAYDLCLSRAVANLSTLSEYCLPFLKRGGYFLSYKSLDTGKEIKQAKKAIHILGGNIDREEIADLNGFDLQHKIIFIKKIKRTPAKFPRKAGTPSKDPLI